MTKIRLWGRTRFLIPFLLCVFFTCGLCLANPGPDSQAEPETGADAEFLADCALLLQREERPTGLAGYAGPTDLLAQELQRRYAERRWILEIGLSDEFPPFPLLDALPEFVAHLDFALQTWKLVPSFPHKDDIEVPFSILPALETRELYINPFYYETDLTLDLVDMAVFAVVLNRMESFRDQEQLQSGLDSEVLLSLSASAGEAVPNEEAEDDPNWAETGGGGTAVATQATQAREDPPIPHLPTLLRVLTGRIAGQMAFLCVYARLRESHPFVRHAMYERWHSLYKEEPIEDVLATLCDLEVFAVEPHAFKGLVTALLQSGLIQKWGLSQMLLGERQNPKLAHPVLKPLAHSTFTASQDGIGPGTRLVDIALGPNHYLFPPVTKLIQTGPSGVLSLNIPKDGTWQVVSYGQGHVISRQVVALPGGGQKEELSRHELRPYQRKWVREFNGVTVESLAMLSDGGESPIYAVVSAHSAPRRKHLIALSPSDGEPVAPSQPLGPWAEQVSSFYVSQKNARIVWYLRDAATGATRALLLTDLIGTPVQEYAFHKPGTSGFPYWDLSGNFWIEHRIKLEKSKVLEWQGFSTELLLMSPQGEVLWKPQGGRLQNAAVVAEDPSALICIERRAGLPGRVYALSRDTKQVVWERNLVTVFDDPYEVPSVIGALDKNFIYLSTLSRVYALERNGEGSYVLFERPADHAIPAPFRKISIVVNGERLSLSYLRPTAIPPTFEPDEPLSLEHYVVPVLP